MRRFVFWLLVALGLGLLRRKRPGADEPPAPATTQGVQPAPEQPGDADGPAGDGGGEDDEEEFVVLPPFVWAVVMFLALAARLIPSAEDPWSAAGILAVTLSALIVTPRLLGGPAAERFDELFRGWREPQEEEDSFRSRGYEKLHRGQRLARLALYGFVVLTAAALILGLCGPSGDSDGAWLVDLAIAVGIGGLVGSFLAVSMMLAVTAAWRTYIGHPGARYVYMETKSVAQELQSTPGSLFAAALLFFIGTTLQFLGAYLP